MDTLLQRLLLLSAAAWAGLGWLVLPRFVTVQLATSFYRFVTQFGAALVLAVDPAPSVVENIAGNWSQDPEVVASLITRNHDEALTTVAYRTKNADVLNMLAKHPSRNVEKMATRNPASSPESLKDAIQNRDRLIKADAIRSLAYHPGGFEWLFEHEPASAAVKAAVEGAASTAGRGRESQKTLDENSPAWYAVTAPNATAEALNILANGGHEKLTEMVVRHPNTDQNTLKAIIKSSPNGWWQIRKAARNHPNAPEEV